MAGITFAISTPSTSNVTSYATGSFTPAAGDLLVVFVIATATVKTPCTVTDSLGETTFSNIVQASKNTSADTLYLFVANSLLATAGARTITFDCTGDAATGAIVTVYRISGMSQAGSSAVRQTGVQSNSTGIPAPVFGSAALTGNPTLGFVANSINPATITPPTNWNEDSDNGYSTPATGSESVSRVSGFTGSTITWGSSVTGYGVISVELDSSALNFALEDDTPPSTMKYTDYDPDIIIWQ